LFLTAARATIAGIAGAAVLLGTGRPIPPRQKLFELFGAGCCTIFAFPLFIALAMMTVPAAHGGVVFGILPLATAAAAAILAHERPSAGFWIASIAGAGLVLAFIVRRSGFEAVSAGDVFLLGAVAAGACGYTLSGKLTAKMPGWEVISWGVVIFLPLAAVITIALWPANFSNTPASAFAGLAYVGLISQYLSFFVFNAAMAMAGVARVGQVLLLQPFVIVALAWPVNGERIEFETLLFAAAVVATVLIGQRMRIKR
jgi:drug/metabolite transporter (DMT)-like permease